MNISKNDKQKGDDGSMGTSENETTLFQCVGCGIRAQRGLVYAVKTTKGEEAYLCHNCAEVKE